MSKKFPKEVSVQIPTNEEGKIEYTCPLCKREFWDDPVILFEDKATTCPNCGKVVHPLPPKEVRDAIKKMANDAYKYVSSEIDEMFKKLK